MFSSQPLFWSRAKRGAQLCLVWQPQDGKQPVGNECVDGGVGNASDHPVLRSVGAQEEELKKEPGLVQAGVLTPASAVGHVLVKRLAKKGHTFKITEG